MARCLEEQMWSQELKKGLEALGNGDFDLARSCFERAHEDAPEQPLVQYALGRELSRAGQFAEAKPLLRSAWSKDPTLIGAAATLARGLGLAERDFDAAESVLSEASESGVEVATLDVVRGELLIERGDFEGAREAALAAEAADDSEVISLSVKAILVRADNLEGVALAANDDYETALFLFRRAQNGDREWAAPHLNSGVAFEALGRTKAALHAANEALAREPDNAEAIALRARLLFRTGNESKAASELASAIEVYPEKTGLAVMLADICAAGGDAETASSILTDLLAQHPKDAEAWLSLGRAQLGAGAIGGAEECFRQALELNPQNSQAMTLLADLLVRDGRYFEAAGLARRAQGLAPAGSSRYRGRDDRKATRRGPRSGRTPR